MKSCNIMMKQKTGIAALNLVQCGDSRFCGEGPDVPEILLHSGFALLLQPEVAGKCLDLQGSQSVFGHKMPPFVISQRYFTGCANITRPTAAAAAVGLVILVP